MNNKVVKLSVINQKIIFKDFFAEDYVECVHNCPDSQCTSNCAREFHENIEKEKS